MALPQNKIKKVKLPNNTEYDIVPTMLQDGTTNYSLTSPTLLQDSELRVVREKEFTITLSDNIPSNYEYFLFEIVPQDPTKYNHFADFEIDIINESVTSSSNLMYKSFRCLLNSRLGSFDITSTNPAPAPEVTVIQNLHYITNTSGSIYVFSGVVAKTPTYSDLVNFIQNGHGYIFGVKNRNPVSIGTGNIKFRVKVFSETNCVIKFLDNVVSNSYNVDTVIDGRTYKKYGANFVEDIYNSGLYSTSIEVASQTAQISNAANTQNIYLVGTTNSSSGKTTLSKGSNNSVYVRNNILNANNGIKINDTFYDNNRIDFYDYDDDDYYNLYFPSKSGTIALTSDITTIPIEDLTEINEE